MICSHTPERSLPFPLPGSAMNRREVQGKTIQTRHICYSYRPKDLHNLLEDFSLVIFPSSSLIQQTRPVTGIHTKLKNSWFFFPHIMILTSVREATVLSRRFMSNNPQVWSLYCTRNPPQEPPISIPSDCLSLQPGRPAVPSHSHTFNSRQQ